MTRHHHDTLPFLIHRIAARVADSVNKEFGVIGVNIYAARVLILLKLDDDRTVGDLAEHAALDQTTLSHILRRLQRQGLVTRTRQEHDNRSVLVSLTDEGKRIAAVCWESAQAHDALLREGLSAADVAELKRMLRRMYENVPLFQVRSDAARLAPTRPDDSARAMKDQLGHASRKRPIDSKSRRKSVHSV